MCRHTRASGSRQLRTAVSSYHPRTSVNGVCPCASGQTYCPPSPLMLFSRATGPQICICSVTNLRSSSGPPRLRATCCVSVTCLRTRSSRRLNARVRAKPLNHRLRRASRRENAPPRIGLKTRKTALRNRRHRREHHDPRDSSLYDRPDHACLNLRNRKSRTADQQIDVTRDDIVHRWSATPVGYMHKLDTRLV